MITLPLFAMLLAAPLADDAFDWEQYPIVRDHVLPTEDEERWLDIPWRGTFWEAMEDARKQDLPVLLWAMNGNPLGCV